MSEPSTVTRFEVIDHRPSAKPFGRVYVEWDVNVTLSYQDQGRTLKAFIDERPAIP